MSNDHSDGHGNSSNGSNRDDILNGSARNDRINGHNGDDQIFGNGGNDVLKGGKGDDVLSGGAGNDILFGNSGKDILLGGAGNDILYGDDKGHGHFSSWWLCKPPGYADYLDGGSGNDKVYGSSGNDFANYTMAENLGAHDLYDGGKGTDTLQLKLTYGEFALTSVQQDISRFELFLDRHGNPGKDNGPVFQFASFDLDASDFETLKIQLVNTGPTANNDAGATNEDTVRTVAKAAGLLANDTDPDHLDVLHVSAFAAVSALGAAVNVNADGSYSYDPTAAAALQALAQGATATDTFTYTIADLAGATSTATVNIKVTGINDAPVAQNDAYSVSEDSTLTVAGTGVLGNDSDIDSAALTALLLSAPAHGTLTLSANGSFIYTPGADFNGSDSFSYRAHDGIAGSGPALVSINVTAVNDAPTAVNDSATVDEDSVAVIAVLANDNIGPANEAGQTLTLLAAQAQHGNVAINADGTLGYTPNADYFGSDTITYTIQDNGTTNGAADPKTAQGQVAVTVGEVNDAPVAVNDTATLDEDGVAVIAVLGNDNTGPANESAQALAVLGAEAQHGNVAINADGTLSYTPNADYFGADTITYTIQDNGTTHGSADPKTAQGQVAVTVADVNDAPVAVDDSATMDANGVAIIAVLDNDSTGPANESAQTLTLSSAGAQHGSVAVNADGTLSYTPDADYSGADTISYTIQDNGTTHGAADPKSASATVAVTINQTNHAPVPVDVATFTNEDTPILFGALIFDTDVDGDTLAVTSAGAFTTTLGAAVVLNADGRFSYDPTVSSTLQALNNGQTAQDGFFYTVGDGHGGTGTAHVGVLVSGVTDASSGHSNEIVPSITDTSGLDYYIRFDDVAGSKWISLGSFAFDMSNPATVFGGGGGAGKATASDLFASMGESDTTTALISMLGAGEHIDDVQIEVYRSNLDSKAQLLEDFKFSNVTLTNLDTGGSAGSSLLSNVGFDFTGFGHRFLEFNPNTGQSTGSSTMTWDFKGNTTGSTALLPDAGGQAINSPLEDQSGGSLDYYVRFEGSDGWLELGSFSLGLDATVAIGGGGAGVGNSTHTDVTLQLGSSSTLLDLGQSLVNGQHVPEVEIEVYRTGGGTKPQLVDEFHFEQVQITKLATANAADNMLQFSFDQFSHAHADLTKTGTIGPFTQDGWDFQGNNQFSGPTPHADATTETPVPSITDTSGLDYYIRFDDVAGSKWISLGSFAFDMSNPATVFGGGGGAGKATASDLFASMGESDTTTALISMLGAGEHIDDVQIEVYRSNLDSKAQLLEDFKFSNVTLTNLDTGGSAGSSLLSNVGFDFTGFGHRFLEFNPNTGQSTGSSTMTWDFKGNTTGSTALLPDAGGQAINSPLEDQSGGSLDYYVRFEGSDGWLELGSFSLGLDATVAIGGGGAGVGNSTHTDVTLQLGSSSTLLDLGQSLVNGQHVPEVEIEVYRTGGGTKPQLVDEFHFEQVQITKLATANAADNMLQFSFDQFSHAHADLTKTGTIGPFTQDGWDFQGNNQFSGPTPHADATTETPVPSITDTSGLDYYIRFDDVAGSKWISLGSFAFDMSNPATVFGGGGGAGKATASDLFASMGESDTTTALISMLGAGEHIDDVQIEVYRSNLDSKAQLLEDFKFSNVTLTNLDTGGSAGSSLLSNVGFDFTGFGHRFLEFNPNTGQSTGSSTMTWDFKGNTTGSTALLPDAGGQAINSPLEDQSGGSLDYYVRFEGSDGWLELGSFSLGLDATVAIGGGGAGVGNSTHTDVTLQLGSSSTLLDLGQSLVNGQHVPEVEIEVYRTGGGTKPQLVDEFHFEQVQITRLATANAADNMLQFSFDQFSHAHADLTKTGTIGPFTQDGWDFQGNNQFSGPTPHADVDFV